MIIVRALYDLKASRALFQVLLVEILWDLGYHPSKAYGDVYMCPDVKPDRTIYWECVLCYVDYVLNISVDPMKTIKGIQCKFKLKDDKIEEPGMYLGADISKILNVDGDEFWSMSYDTYCQAVVNNFSKVLEKKGLQLPSKCSTPLSNGYLPGVDTIPEIKSDGVQYYQGLVGVLLWLLRYDEWIYY